MDWNKQTIKVYDDSAVELAEYFSSHGPRIDDIDRAFTLAGDPADARVVEIGCGDGRDATVIAERSAWYQGFDPSAGLLDIARAKLPNTSFVQADATTYDYPSDIDIVFAFASLLHVTIDDLPTVFDRVAQSLKPGGIFYLSLKARDEYTAETKVDKYGERMFYYYNPDIITEIAGDQFDVVYVDNYWSGDTEWFTIALARS